MGPRGPPGPAGAPVSTGPFLLEGGDTDAFKLSDVSLRGANLVSSPYFLGTSRISRQPWGTWGTRRCCEYLRGPCPPWGELPMMYRSDPDPVASRALPSTLRGGGLKGNPEVLS